MKKVLIALGLVAGAMVGAGLVYIRVKKTRSSKK